VRAAGGVERLPHVGGDAGLHAEQNPGEQGCLRLRDGPGDEGLRPALDGEERAQQRAAVTAIHDRHLRVGDQGEDPAPGQIVLVGEVVELRRRERRPGEADAVAVGIGAVARSLYQRRAMHRLGHAGDQARVRIDAQVDLPVTDIRLVRDRAGEGLPALAVVVGQRAGAGRGAGGCHAHHTQQGRQRAQQEQAQRPIAPQ